MKLAIFTPGFMPVPDVNGGAIEQLITKIIDANEIEKTFDIDIYTKDNVLLNEYKFERTNLIRVSNKENFLILKRIKNKILSFIGKDRINYLELKMVKRFKRNYYDIVLVENNMNLYKRVQKKLTNERLFFHLHNDFNDEDLSKTVNKTRYVIDTADGIIVVSNFLKKKLLTLGAKKVYVVPNVVNKSDFQLADANEIIKLKETYNITEKDFVFLFVGRLTREKGIDKLLLALKSLRKYKNVKCVIVGDNIFNSSDDGAYIEYLKEISESMKNTIKFTGHVNNNELYKYYSIVNCVVIPSQCEEAFGMVALEGMLMKKPIIASKAGGLLEVPSSKGAEFITRDKFFVRNLSLTMKKLIENPLLCAEMAKYNYEKAQTFPLNSLEYFNLVKGVLLKNK